MDINIKSFLLQLSTLMKENKDMNIGAYNGVLVVGYFKDGKYISETIEMDYNCGTLSHQIIDLEMKDG